MCENHVVKTVVNGCVKCWMCENQNANTLTTVVAWALKKGMASSLMLTDRAFLMRVILLLDLYVRQANCATMFSATCSVEG